MVICQESTHMNENQKVNTPKAKLPRKTRIAIWWLFAVVIVGTIAIVISSQATTDWWVLSLICIAHGLCYILPVILICMKNRTAWIAAVVILSIALYFWLVFIFITAVPFILIILDRKNYFEMVRLRELEKKENP